MGDMSAYRCPYIHEQDRIYFLRDKLKKENAVMFNLDSYDVKAILCNERGRPKQDIETGDSFRYFDNWAKKGEKIQHLQKYFDEGGWFDQLRS